MTDEEFEIADEIVAAAVEQMHAAGLAGDDLPHALIASGLALLETSFCRAHLAAELQIVEDAVAEVRARIVGTAH